MIASVAFFGLLASAWGLQPQFLRNQLDGKIVGGRPINIKEAPHQISLQPEGYGHHCGGSIISKRYVVTAAHCVKFNVRYLIRAGSSYSGKGGVVVRVSRVFIHPEYVTPDYDIAVLRLEKNLQFNENIQPIPLAEENEQVPAGAQSLTSGWGRLYLGGPLPFQLQAVQVPIVDNKKCQRIYSHSTFKVTKNMICAGFDRGGKDHCEGDSGGPLVLNGKLVGIVSWARGCALPGYPGVYASVPALRKFIKRTTGI